MAIRWSWASPRIALIPAPAITGIAFFGAIFWTIWISFTQSRRFPDYAIDLNGRAKSGFGRLIELAGAEPVAVLDVPLGRFYGPCSGPDLQIAFELFGDAINRFTSFAKSPPRHR